MSFQNAAEELKALSNKFKSIISVSDFLEKVGSLDQAAKDAVVRKDAAYKAEAEAKAKQLEAEKVLDAAYKKVADVNAEKDKTIDLASKKAAEILADAQAKAVKILDEAKGKNKLAEAAVSDAKKTVEQCKAEVAAKKDELQSLQKQIDDLKNKISAFVR